MAKIINLNSSASVVGDGGDDVNLIGDFTIKESPYDSPLKEHVVQSMGEKTKGTILRAMAVFTAIELYGSFLTGKTGRNTTADNFTAFCKSEYMPLKYHTVCDLLYNIFRNGIAHSYIPKGAAHLSANLNDKNFHLEFLQDGLFIYVPTLADDVIIAIASFYNKLKEDRQLKDNYRNVINELNRQGTEAYLNFIKKNDINPRQDVSIKRGIGIDIESQ